MGTLSICREKLNMIIQRTLYIPKITITLTKKKNRFIIESLHNRLNGKKNSLFW